MRESKDLDNSVNNVNIIMMLAVNANSNKSYINTSKSY